MGRRACTGSQPTCWCLVARTGTMVVESADGGIVAFVHCYASCRRQGRLLHSPCHTAVVHNRRRGVSRRLSGGMWVSPTFPGSPAVRLPCPAKDLQARPSGNQTHLGLFAGTRQHRHPPSCDPLFAFAPSDRWCPWLFIATQPVVVIIAAALLGRGVVAQPVWVVVWGPDAYSATHPTSHARASLGWVQCDVVTLANNIGAPCMLEARVSFCVSSA